MALTAMRTKRTIKKIRFLMNSVLSEEKARALFSSCEKECEVLIALFQVIMEPACSHGDDVARQFID